MQHDRLSADNHVTATIAACSKSLYALRVIRTHGMSTPALHSVYRATVVSKLIYCSPAWSGFCSVKDRDRIDSFIKRSVTAPTKSKRSMNYSPMLIKLYSSKCWLIRTTHFTNVFHQLTVMITILENNLIITNFLPSERFSNSQTLILVRYSMTLIKLLNKYNWMYNKTSPLMDP